MPLCRDIHLHTNVLQPPDLCKGYRSPYFPTPGKPVCILHWESSYKTFLQKDILFRISQNQPYMSAETIDLHVNVSLHCKVCNTGAFTLAERLNKLAIIEKNINKQNTVFSHM